MMADTKEHDRLRWRCRRGMRELDELLQPFASRYLADLGSDELASFCQLLECQDHKLLAYLMLNEIPADQGWVNVIKKIRASAAD